MKRAVMNQVLVIGSALLLLAACEKGPMQKAGERVDEALGQDRLLGRGPAEKAGKKVDTTVDDLKK